MCRKLEKPGWEFVMPEMLSDPYFTICDSRFEWLRNKRNGWQFGEQGLIDAIVAQLSPVWRVGIEIGAGDGDGLPLTLSPLYDRKWKIIAYEADEESQIKLVQKYQSLDVRGAYNFGPVPKCSVAVIDIDGHDSLAMDAFLSHTIPYLLVVEHYDQAGPYVRFEEDTFDQPIPRWLLGMPLGIPQNPGFLIQSPFHHLDAIASKYEMIPVCRTRVNSFYVSNWLAKDLCNV